MFIAYIAGFERNNISITYLSLDCQFGDKILGCLDRLCPYYVNPEVCCETCHDRVTTTTYTPSTTIG